MGGVAGAQGGTTSAAGTAQAGAAGSAGGVAGTPQGGAGTAGDSGNAGAAGSLQEADAGPDPFAPMPSTGCSKPAAQQTGSYIRQTVTGSTRVYDLYIPEGYDQNTAHRAIFIDHGCDGSIPWSTMPEITEGDAILIALRAESSQNSGMPYGGGCFDTGPGSNSLTEVAYFDQVLEDVSNNYCIDTHRVFMSGYSSGSWLTNLLGCVRAGVIRGQGNAAGGLPDVPECAGPIAAMLCHDMQDDQNVFAEGEKARDRILAINGCSTNTEPYDWDGDPNTESTCVMYQGCMPGYPVVWCPSMNKGHSDQAPVATVGMWHFWSQF
jgi:polyhydroxybutyrate depolymerase